MVFTAMSAVIWKVGRKEEKRREEKRREEKRRDRFPAGISPADSAGTYAFLADEHRFHRCVACDVKFSSRSIRRA